MPLSKLLRAAAFCALNLVAVSAFAVGVTGNDAGSGRDAGDVPAQALPITPGYYTGALSAAGDPMDWYALQVQKGDRIRVTFSSYVLTLPSSMKALLLGPAGDARYLDPAGYFVAGRSSNVFPAFEAIAHEGGTWYLRAEATNAGVPGSYGLRLEVNRGYGVIVNARNTSWIVIEGRASQAVNLLFQGRIQKPVNWDGVHVGELMQETRFDGRSPSRSGWHVIGGGAATSVSTTYVPVSDDTAEPLLYDTTDGDSFSSWAPINNVKGDFRFVVSLTQDDPWLSAGVWASGPVEISVRQGGGYVTWSETNHGADTALVTPVVSTVGPRTLNLPLTDNFRGRFAPYSAPDAYARRPDGSIAPLHPSCDCLIFTPRLYENEWAEHPMPGTWTFHLGETETWWYRTPYLAGVFVEYPGLF